MDQVRLSQETFGALPDGRAVERLWLHGAGGFAAAIITYGAAVQALFVPDRQGRVADVVLGHDDLDGYVANRRFFGASVGRYANRIAGAAFALDDTRHPLSANDGANALHGGPDGFDRHLWTVAEAGEGGEPFVTLTRRSPDGEEGYPGTLDVSITYRILGGTTLSIAFTATTDRPTVVNLTHHGFFNLAGVEKSADILGHELTLYAERYLPIDAGAIPLGGPAPVAGTPFDFREPHAIGTRIRDDHPQLAGARGYDHSYCVADAKQGEPRLAARLRDPESGRVMDLLTDQPGVQFYSGNYLDGTAHGKYARLYRQSDALCLEPQTWPDTPNRPDFPPARLDPGETYRHVSLYRFLND